MSQIKVVSWCHNRTLHWILSSWLTSVLYTIIQHYEARRLDYGTILYCLIQTTVLYQTVVERLFDTDVIYSPKGVTGYSKHQAEALLRASCQPLGQEDLRSPD